jgi:hypothetical protein
MRAYDVTGRLLWRRFAGQAPALVPYRGYTQVILTPQPQWQPFTPGPPGFGRPVLTYVLDARSGQTIALQRSRGIVRLLPDPAA